MFQKFSFKYWRFQFMYVYILFNIIQRYFKRLLASFHYNLIYIVKSFKLFLQKYFFQSSITSETTLTFMSASNAEIINSVVN